MHQIAATAPIAFPVAIAVPAEGLDKCATGPTRGSAQPGQDAMPSLPPGACPGGGTVRLGGVGAGVGLVPSLRQGGALGQGARSDEREQDPMKPGTVRLAGAGPVPGREARTAALGRHSVQRATVRPGGVVSGAGSIPGQGARSRDFGRHPHTTGDGAAGRRGCRGGADRWARGTVPRPRTTPHTTGDGAAGRGGCRGAPVPGQGARSVECRQEPMNGETVRLDGATAGAGSAPGLRQGGTLWRRARSVECRQGPMMSLPPGACPGGETVRLDGADAGVGPVAGLQPGGRLSRWWCGVVRRADAGVAAVAVLEHGGTLGQEARSIAAPCCGDGRNKMLWEWAAAALIILLVVQNPSIGEIR